VTKHHIGSPEAQIRTLIDTKGKITFAEFMDVALFHRDGGYYVNVSASGPNHDYYTSPGAHPAFAASIAIQLIKMWEFLKCPTRFDVVEIGAGNGILAEDITRYSRNISEQFHKSLHYLAIDRSGVQNNEDNPDYDRIISSKIPVRDMVGCFISNELLDSFPVHRFQVKNGSIKEIYVTIKNDKLTEILSSPSTPLIEQKISDLGYTLPDKYKGEVNLNLGPWISDVYNSLTKGFVITVDYGHLSEKLYSPMKTVGTLDTYFRNTRSLDIYENIGKQDITAHVDFSSLIFEGEAVGFKTLEFSTQSKYLSNFYIAKWLQELRVQKIPRSTIEANTLAMRELTREDGLGKFKVLIQEKNTGSTSQMISPDNTAINLPIPFLRSDHVKLMENKYPHTQWQLEELWQE